MKCLGYVLLGILAVCGMVFAAGAFLFVVFLLASLTVDWFDLASSWKPIIAMGYGIVAVGAFGGVMTCLEERS